MTSGAAKKVEEDLRPKINTAEDAAIACLREEITDDEYKEYVARLGNPRTAFTEQFLKGFAHELPKLPDDELPRLDGKNELMHPTEPIEGTLVKEEDRTKATEKVVVTNVDGDPTKTRTETGHVHVPGKEGSSATKSTSDKK